MLDTVKYHQPCENSDTLDKSVVDGLVQSRYKVE